MKISNFVQSKKIRLLFLTLIILALPLAVILNQNTQIFQPRAATVGQPVVQESSAVNTPVNSHYSSSTISNQTLYVAWADTNAAIVAERGEESGAFSPTTLGSAGNRPFYFTNRVAAGNDGTIHSVWIDGGTTVHYRKKPPGQGWENDMVIGTNQNFANSISLISHGNTVIALWRLSQGELIFAYSNDNGGSWSTTGAVPGGVSYGGIPGITVTNDGTIYLVWVGSDFNIRLGQWSGTNFSNAIIIQGNKDLFNPQITSYQGTLYLSMRSLSKGPTLAERKNDGTWATMNVFPETKSNGAGQFGIAADANGNIHFAWSAQTTSGESQVKYAIKPLGGSFSSPIIISTNDLPGTFKSNITMSVSVRPTYSIAHVTWDSGAGSLVGIRYARVVTSYDGSTPPTAVPPTAAPAPAMGSTKLGIFARADCTEAQTAVDGGPRILKVSLGEPPDQNLLTLMRTYKTKYPNGIVVYRFYDDLQATNTQYKKTDDPVASADNYYNRFVKFGLDRLSPSDRALVDYVTADNEFTAFDANRSLQPLSPSSNPADQQVIADNWLWYGKFWTRVAENTVNYNGRIKPLIAQIPVGNPVLMQYLDPIMSQLNRMQSIGAVMGYHGYTRQYTTDIATELNGNSLYYRKIHDYIASKGGGDWKFIIDESGVDDKGNGTTDGWQARGTADKFEDWLGWYDGMLKQDAYVLGTTVFVMCGGTQWSSFSLDPIASWLRTYFGGVPYPVPATPTPKPAQPGAGVCGKNNYDCICKTTGENNGSCLAKTAPWASSAPGNAWASCSPAKPQSFCDPSAAGSQSTSGPGAATLIIEIKNKNTGGFVDAKSGNLFVSAEDGHDSDNYNLSGPTTQAACSRIAVGKIKCNKYADNWYGGMSDTNVTDGYRIDNAGVIAGRDTALSVVEGGIITFTVWLDPLLGGAGGPNDSNPDFVPNCLNIQGPTTIHLGDTVTYLAQYSGPLDGALSGTINAVKTTNPNPKNASQWEWGGDGKNSTNWPPKETGYVSGVLSFKWAPEEAGVYQVFCRAFNANVNNSECRGPANTVDGPPRYWCKGPGASITVNVTAGGVDTADSQADMCEFATTIGGNVMQLGEGTNTQGPLVISAIAKAGVNVKQYSFAFYNQDNDPANPKPIFFAANIPYVITSETNSVTVPDDVFTKPDLNNAGKKATNIKVNAFFTNADGIQSLTDSQCSVNIHGAGPTATPVPPTNTPTPAATQSGQASLIATMGVLIIAVIVSLNFFFH